MPSPPAILLVEDHAATRKQVRAALEASGFTVYEARDGAAALQLMRAHQPSLVLQDLILPDVDGFALAAELRQLSGDAPLRMIAFTGLAAGSDASRIRALGFDDVIAKPILPSQLAELLRTQHAPEAAVPKPVELSDGELLRRCSALSAELTIVSSLAETLLREGDVEAAIVSALSACLDAGHSSFGALYLLERDASLRVRTLGSDRRQRELSQELPCFFAQESWLRGVIARGEPVLLSDCGREGRDVLRRAGLEQAVLVPLVDRQHQLGALFMSAPAAGRGDSSAFRDFALDIAAQTTIALALAEAYRCRQVGERAAEQQRRLAREQATVWRGLVHAVPDVLMHLDADGRVRFINRLPRWLEPRSRLPSWFELFDAEHHEEMRAALDGVFTRAASCTLETTQRGPSGELIWTESHLGPLHGNGHEVSGALVIQRDVSAKRQAEAELLLSDRLASVGTLAAAVANEVQTPLACLLSNLELAADEAARGEVPRELCDELSDAQEAARRVRDIVGDLQVFSRADEPLDQPTDLARVLDSALRMASNELRTRACLERSFADVPPVRGGESRLGQVFLCLLLHVARGLEEGRPERHAITVQLYRERERAVVLVCDTGRALSERERERLFRARGSSRPPGASDDSGLAICQRLLAQVGGSLSVEASSRGGNEWRVALPLSEAARRDPARVRISEVHALRRGRVLVIDGERLVVQLARRMLAREHDVTALDSAQAALRELEAGERFDVIVCDLMMPGMSGMELHRRVALQFPEQAERIVFVTEGQFTARAREYLAQIDNQRVQKPLDGRELRAVVNGLLR